MSKCTSQFQGLMFMTDVVWSIVKQLALKYGSGELFTRCLLMQLKSFDLGYIAHLAYSQGDNIPVKLKGR